MKKMKLTVAGPNTIDRIKRPAFKGMQFAQIVLRPGSLNVLNAPSRIGNTLFHVDGSTEAVA